MSRHRPEAPMRRIAEPPPLAEAIAIARLICILGIVYVHGWTGLGGDMMQAQAGSSQDVMRWTMVELFGRSAVPLLSIVSGWLAVRSLAWRGGRSFLAGKARSVALPMLAWNALALLLVSGLGWLGLLHDVPLPGDAAWFLDNLLCLTRPGDVNVQTAFLRDLLVCMAATPLLVRLPNRWLLPVIAVAAAWQISGWHFALLLRPAILAFFTLGIVARRHGLAERLASISVRTALLPFVALVPVKIALSVVAGGGPGFDLRLLAAVDMATRVAAALLVWRTAVALARMPAGRSLLGLERYAFFLFCSHLLFMWLLAPAIGGLTGTMGSPAWPIFFLAQPLLCLAFAILLALCIEGVSPRLADLLSGGRLGNGHRASPAARPLAHAH